MTLELPEKKESLLQTVLAPALWAVHFLLSYATAAVWCAKAGAPGDSLRPVQVAIGAYTVAALAGIGAVGWRGWRRHRLAGSAPPHDRDTPEDRHRFLGLATVLLAGLSAVAVLYAALAAVLIGSCQ